MKFFSVIFWWNSHFSHNFMKKFCFFMILWKICVLSAILWENFHNLLANFLFISWSFIKILFFLTFLCQNSHLFRNLQQKVQHFCDFLKNLHFVCDPLTKFAFCPWFFQEICISTAILWQNLHFVPDYLTKFAFCSWSFVEIHIFFCNHLLKFTFILHKLHFFLEFFI